MMREFGSSRLHPSRRKGKRDGMPLDVKTVWRFAYQGDDSLRWTPADLYEQIGRLKMELERLRKKG